MEPLAPAAASVVPSAEEATAQLSPGRPGIADQVAPEFVEV